MTPQRMLLPDGRLHLSHGPIDLLIQADGPADAVQAAHQRAWRRFETLLTELVGELPAIQAPIRSNICSVTGSVARRMWNACHPYLAEFVTPMAAVAGAVAQEIVDCYADPAIERAAVNNGGDIALYLSAGASYRVGLCTDIDAATDDALRGALRADGSILIGAQTLVRGVATSGWRGRSFSLGIADCVTVLAATAAQADVAATMIANAVNVDDVRIRRSPACELKDNTDLGGLLVTVEVPQLEPELVESALQHGLARAQYLRATNLIEDAILVCQGRVALLPRQGHERRMNSPPAINSFSTMPVNIECLASSPAH